MVRIWLKPLIHALMKEGINPRTAVGLVKEKKEMERATLTIVIHVYNPKGLGWITDFVGIQLDGFESMCPIYHLDLVP